MELVTQVVQKFSDSSGKEDLLLSTQETDTGPYPQPDESSLHPHKLFYSDPF
jgi:hypothetical protein